MAALGRLGSLNKRVLYWIVVVVLSLPLIWPMGLPLKISDLSNKAFSLVEGLKPGSVVLFSVDFESNSLADLGPQVEALLRHLLSRPVRIIATGFSPSGPLIFESYLSKIGLGGKIYGKDVVNLGYRAGEEGAIAAATSDIQGTFAKDFRGTPIDQISMMAGIKSVKDVNFLVTVGNFSSAGPASWIRQVVDKYKLPFVHGSSQISVPEWMPYVKTGQMSALLAGITSAAEYEILTDKPGTAVAGLDAVTLGDALLLVLLVAGNLSHFAGKRMAREGGGAK